MLRAPFIVRSLAPTQSALKVAWSDGATSVFSGAWLRAQVRDSKYFDASAKQYSYDHLPFVATPAAIINAELVGASDAEVKVAWSDHSSSFNASWLRAQDMPLNRSCFPQLAKEKPWSSMDKLPEYHFDERREKMAAWMTDLRVWGAILVRGVPTSERGLRDFMELMGPIQQRYHTNYIFNLVITPELMKDDRSYTPEHTNAHTDAVDYDYTNKIGCFHGIEYSNPESKDDVMNFLVDGFEVLEHLCQQDPEAFSDLTSPHWGHARRRPGAVPPAINVLKETYERDWLTQRPLVRTNEGKITQLSFRYLKHAELAPCSEESANIERRYQSYAKMLEMLEDPAVQQRFVLTPGTMVVFDNHRLVHGRTKIVPGVSRRVNGSFISSESFFSRWRLLMGEKAKIPEIWLYACPHDSLDVLAQRWESESLGQ